MNVILWIIVGGLAGWLASLIMHTDAQQGWIMNIILGVVGAVVGGLIMNIFGAPGVTGFDLYSIVVAVLGAGVVIGIGKGFLYR